MKKILLGCLATSVVLTGLALYKLTTYQPDIKIPVQSINRKSTPVANTQPAYALTESEILTHITKYLTYYNLEQILHPTIQKDGTDFIITLENKTDPTQDKHILKLVNIADFNGKKQYKITSASPIVWFEMMKQAFDAPSLVIETYEKNISWVPELSLESNTSLKATKLAFTNANLSVNIDSIISDSMVGPYQNKMDIAALTDIENFTLTSPFLTISIPHLTEERQIIGSNQVGNPTLQTLSANSTKSELRIPSIHISAPILGNTPLTAEAKADVVFDKELMMNLHLDHIKSSFLEYPLFPQKITVQIAIGGISKPDLITYTDYQQQLQNLENPETPEGISLTEKLITLQNKIVSKLHLNIRKVDLILKDGSISISGDIKPEDIGFATNIKLAVTNFEKISPVSTPQDKNACEKALAGLSEVNPAALPKECQPSVGALEFLRPYLETAEHTKNSQGQSVATFTISYRANNLMINNQVILSDMTMPKNDATDIHTSTDLMKDTAK